MRALVQRVTRASVTVFPPGADRAAASGVVTGAIEAGFVVLVGVHARDTRAEAAWLARKVAALRICADESGRMNRSIVDTGGGILVVSQFTLYGDAARGNRPSFVEAALPGVAEPVYVEFLHALAHELGRRVETGTFGADMEVSLVNDGPVTLLVERLAPP